MVVVNAEELILGRMASEIAKKLLKGEKVEVINAEKTVIIGSKEFVSKKFKKRLDLQRKGNPHFGPKYPRKPDAIVKRAVRGMLPYRRKRGIDALKKLKVFIGKPKEITGNVSSIEIARKREESNFVFLGDISKALGAKW
ncbi:MAG: 50S ribosomal protein L13 [archaeon]|nr:50S ribosomal protein L13 [Candidatus Micrarchaeota archaeon]